MAPDATRTDKQRKRLIGLLEELFQLDQPDLDFGFYKIMRAKAEVVSDFIQNDLLEIIKSTFGEADEVKIKEARQEYEQAVEQAKSFGAPDPEMTEPVQKAKAAYDAAKDSGVNECEIYEHLYRFFGRYYDNGDFISRRYFVRETGGRAASYAIPYDGREVYLHWANRDQYYIKTSEYLTNFTFDIARHFIQERQQDAMVPDSLKLHCRIVDATEGEQNNNKTTDKTERFFLIFSRQPAVMENGDLVLQFEYRPDEEKSGTAAKWQEKRLGEAESAILHALTGIGEARYYNEILRTEIGEDKTRHTLLRKYLNQYTKRNTIDYFIHKDLGRFLKRELDFYIKNEIMRLDDIESANAPRVQAYLDKIKVLRKIAGQLITFLAQLEDFQKKLWLKKKFVTETQYCITLDRIPEKMYADIAANDAQREEWVTLFAIDELDGYSKPLNVEFLKANLFLVLDTAFFPGDFKDALMAGIQGFDESLDGVLVHSENFQALELMQDKYRGQVECIYIDPPYNTDSAPIAYKNNYKDSSWCSLIANRVYLSKNLIIKTGVSIVAIDDVELRYLTSILDEVWGKENYISTITTHCNPQGRVSNKVSKTSEHHILHALDIDKLGEIRVPKLNVPNDTNLKRTGTNSRRHERPKRFYPILYKNKELHMILDSEYNLLFDYESKNFNDTYLDELKQKYKNKGYEFILPVNKNKEYLVWQREFERVKREIKTYSYDGVSIKTPAFLDEVPKTTWLDSCFANPEYGSEVLKNIMGSKLSENTAKSISTLMQFIHLNSSYLTLDYFAGSGTTGHAVVNLNREDGGKRKYIMVEMGNYFDTVTRPRMQKVVYSQDWKGGKPISRDGISHAFKYIHLESYEDTLNNLSFRKDAARDQTLQSNDDFRRDYMLKYWLEFETKGSPSLLNIEQFDDPTAYMLKLKKPGSDAYEEKAVDLVESFNWLIGLHVDHLDKWHSYSANFRREPDPELPDDENTRLILDGCMEESDKGQWLFRKVEGRVCRTPPPPASGNMNNTDRVLVIWRKLTGNLEEDNLMLDEWFRRYRLSTQSSDLDVIYVNGSNNLANLCQGDEHWKVRLIEEAFHQQMWNPEV